jgi:hypothetical protein
MSDGDFKLAQLQLGRIYPMGLGYIRSKGGGTVLEPDKAQINPVGQRYPTRAAATTLETDGGRINPTS